MYISKAPMKWEVFLKGGVEYMSTPLPPASIPSNDYNNNTVMSPVVQREEYDSG